MKLIIDSGSTKMHLCLLAPDGSHHQWERPGVNALTASPEELRAIFSNEEWPRLRRVYFYGAGMTGTDVRDKITGALPPADLCPEIESDLLGAARALFPGGQHGIACILGTGSNSGLFDGRAITRNIPPLGFIIGDEGSGTSIAKNFLRRLYRGEYPPELLTLFEQELGLTYADVLQGVYRRPAANRFLASLTRFIKSHIDSFPALRETVIESFDSFQTNVTARYGERRIGFIGGIAVAFREELLRVFSPQYQIIDIQERPMDGLIKYHSLQPL